MSVLGKWRITRIPDYRKDYPDMIEPAYILFEEGGSGEFAFGCVTAQIFGGADGGAVAFSWNGNDEMEETSGDGWAKLQTDGSLKGAICFQGGDDVNFVARRWSSSTACQYYCVTSGDDGWVGSGCAVRSTDIARDFARVPRSDIVAR